jgi:peptidyl-prolyl cis-trans isomerase SurA
MKRLLHGTFVAALLLWGFALLPLCRAAFAAEAEAVDGIAAIVNGDAITYSQVRSVSATREKVLQAQYTGEELVNKIKEARKAALQDLIDRQLILQAFKKEKYEIPDHFVDERMHEIINESFGGDRNTFVKTLEAQNYTLGEFKKLETERMIVQAMRSKNIKRNMAVSPTKIEDYYRTHRDEFTSKEEIKLRMIMIPSRADTGNAAAQKAMAEEILGKLANGASFERLAQIYSEDSTRELGGDWGWIERKTLATPLEQVAFNLPVGRVSRIIDYNGNYYILKVEEKRGGETKSLAEVRDEIEKKLTQLEAQHLQEKWLASLRSKAYIRTF